LRVAKLPNLHKFHSYRTLSSILGRREVNSRDARHIVFVNLNIDEDIDG